MNYPHRMNVPCLLAMPLLCLTSCATITRGVHEKLKVDSDPTGAHAVLSTGESGVTPTVFVKKRRTAAFTVTVSKPGYFAETVKIESRVSPTGGTAMAGNVLLGGVVGAAIDAGSGAYNSLYPNPVKVELKPRDGRRRSKPTPTANPSAIPRR